MGRPYRLKKENKMDINTEIQNNLAIKIANLTLESTTYQAMYQNEVTNHNETKQQLTKLQSVLDSNEDLKSLFDEDMNKNKGE